MTRQKHRLIFLSLGLLVLLTLVLAGCGQEAGETKKDPGVRDARRAAIFPDNPPNDGSTGKTATGQGVAHRPLEASFYEVKDSQGGVGVEVTWLTPEYLQARNLKMSPEQEKDLTTNLVFNIVVTTHSGDLRAFDFARAARLKVNGRDAAPGTWEFVSQDGHHPEGMLRFKAPGNEPIKELILSINNLRGVPAREFKWQL